MSIWTRLEELRASARYHRRRLDLYSRRQPGQDPADPERLEDLEQASQRADARVTRAEADFSQPDEQGEPPAS